MQGQSQGEPKFWEIPRAFSETLFSFARYLVSERDISKTKTLLYHQSFLTRAYANTREPNC
jgi:hypothetical protein